MYIISKFISDDDIILTLLLLVVLTDLHSIGLGKRTGGVGSA